MEKERGITFLFRYYTLLQYGGPDGEANAAFRYLSQRYAFPYKEGKAILTDIGTEELGHLEIVATIIHQLTRNLTIEEIEESGFGPYYIDHTTGIWAQAAGGVPFNSNQHQSKGDPITDLFESMAAEQKARSTYDNILRVVKDPDVCEPIRWLREREVVHFQRFGEAKRTRGNRYERNGAVCSCRKRPGRMKGRFLPIALDIADSFINFSYDNSTFPKEPSCALRFQVH